FAQWRIGGYRHPSRHRGGRFGQEPDSRRRRAMTAFFAIMGRDLRLALRQGGDILTLVLFFVIVGVLMPFAVGPDRPLLAQLAPAIIWVAALLAQLLSNDRLFRTDFEDGSLAELRHAARGRARGHARRSLEFDRPAADRRHAHPGADAGAGRRALLAGGPVAGAGYARARRFRGDRGGCDSWPQARWPGCSRSRLAA